MLTNAEYQQVKRHAAEGCRLLDAVPGLSADPAYPLLYALCRHHHERWDGSGYPDGLRGDAIPGFVQVVGLADAYDALVSSRVYKSLIKIPAHTACTPSFPPYCVDLP